MYNYIFRTAQSLQPITLMHSAYRSRGWHLGINNDQDESATLVKFLVAAYRLLTASLRTEMYYGLK